MRFLLAIPLLFVGACNVERDKGNDTTSVTINEAALQNTAEDVGNKVQNIAEDVGNEAQNLGDKAKNTDLDVKVDKDEKTENKSR